MTIGSGIAIVGIWVAAGFAEYATGGAVQGNFAAALAATFFIAFFG